MYSFELSFQSTLNRLNRISRKKSCAMQTKLTLAPRHWGTLLIYSRKSAPRCQFDPDLWCPGSWALRSYVELGFFKFNPSLKNPISIQFVQGLQGININLEATFQGQFNRGGRRKSIKRLRRKLRRGINSSFTRVYFFFLFMLFNYDL